MSIGLRIKELKLSIGLGQIDFANKIGIKQSPLSQMESGKIFPSIDTISNIIREFNISYSWLIDGVEDNPLKDIKKFAISEHLPKIVTVDSLQNDNIVLVPTKAATVYLLSCNDLVFISELPSFHLPNLHNFSHVSV